jgi:hypothetical protein
MDGLTSLLLAGRVSQIVKFSLTLISTSKKLYHSSDGALAVDIDTGIIAGDIYNRMRELQTHQILCGRDIDGNLKLLCDQCIAVGQELISVLNSNKVKDKGRKYSSVKKAIRVVLTKPQVKELRMRLTNLEGHIERHIQSLRNIALRYIISRLNRAEG